jgi:hypothetical protein
MLPNQPGKKRSGINTVEHLPSGKLTSQQRNVDLDFFVLTAHVPVSRDKDPLEKAFSLTQNHEIPWVKT